MHFTFYYVTFTLHLSAVGLKTMIPVIKCLFAKRSGVKYAGRSYIYIKQIFLYTKKQLVKYKADLSISFKIYPPSHYGKIGLKKY